MAFKWFGGQFLEQFEKQSKQRLQKSCMFLENRAKESVSVGVVKVKGIVIERSKAGEPPRRETGILKNSITHEVVGQTGRVGSNEIHAKFAELGTKNMEARPFLAVLLTKFSAALATILAGKPFQFKNQRMPK